MLCLQGYSKPEIDLLCCPNLLRFSWVKKRSLIHFTFISFMLELIVMIISRHLPLLNQIFLSFLSLLDVFTNEQEHQIWTSLNHTEVDDKPTLYCLPLLQSHHEALKPLVVIKSSLLLGIHCGHWVWVESTINTTFLIVRNLTPLNLISAVIG